MERCQVAIAGKAIGVNLMRSEWAVSACQPGIYSRSPGELFLTPAGCTHTHTHTSAHPQTYTWTHVQPVLGSCTFYCIFGTTLTSVKRWSWFIFAGQSEVKKICMSWLFFTGSKFQHQILLCSFCFSPRKISGLRWRRWKYSLPGDLWPQQREPSAYLRFYDTVCFVRVHIKYTGSRLMLIFQWSYLFLSLLWL